MYLQNSTCGHKCVIHCIKTKAYIAQKCVNIHSGPDSKVMHRFTTRMPFSQSSVMMMDTSPVHRIWHAKARYARFLTVPTAWVIHITPGQHTGLSLAGWTRPPFAIIHCSSLRPSGASLEVGQAIFGHFRILVSHWLTAQPLGCKIFQNKTIHKHIPKHIGCSTAYTMTDF